MAAGHMLIILDDLSTILMQCYGQASTVIGYPATPNIDALAAAGKRFTKYLVHTYCSPTRASMLSGHLPFRTGLGVPLDFPHDGPGLDPNTYTLCDLIKALGLNHKTALIGKGHVNEMLSGVVSTSPSVFGFDHNVWVPANPASPYGGTYFVNGVETPVAGGYLTEIFSDAAVAWINAQTDPYFIWYAPPLVHGPWWRPPPGTYNNVSWVLPDLECPTSFGALADQYLRAMCEAVDFYIGEMLAAITPALRANLTIWIVSDNGSPGTMVQNELWAFDGSAVGANRGKRSVFRNGIEAPLIVNGPGIAAGVPTALVQCTDIYRTIAERCNGGATVDHLTYPRYAGRDSISFNWAINGTAPPVGRRMFAVSESFDPNGQNQGTSEGVRAVTDGRYKIMWQGGPAFEKQVALLFDLQNDQGERLNMLAAGAGSGCCAHENEEALSAYLRGVYGLS